MPAVALSRPLTCCLCHQAITSVWNTVLKAPVCEACSAVFRYDTPNEWVVGQPLKRLPSFSIEFEVAASRQVEPRDLDRALLLIKYHFKRTQDGTVDYEYKSPIYQNLGAARKAIAVMDTLSDLVSERCGTHLHVACRHKASLLPIQGDIFSPLLTHMLGHPEETTRFWGRYFGQYATPVNKNRYHCFSLESKHQTLEFRLPRFRSAEQYVQVIKCARALVAYLDRAVETFIEMHPFQARPRWDEPAAPEALRGLPGMIGQHALGIYRAHVARGKPATSWFARLSPQEQARTQIFPAPPPERRVRADPDEEDDTEEEEDDGSW
jgi:hypothetical protein